MKNPIQSAGEAMPSRPNEQYFGAWAKCRDLGKQLAKALAETGDDQIAYIQPEGRPYAVSFGSGDPEHNLPEAAVQRVDRLAALLAVAMDDWNDASSTKWVAHVHGASTGRGVWYRNDSIDSGRADITFITSLAGRHREALNAWDAADVPSDAVNREINESRKALLDFRPASHRGMQFKAETMLGLRSVADWDDFDRADLIRAFTDGKGEAA